MGAGTIGRLSASAIEMNKHGCQMLQHFGITIFPITCTYYFTACGGLDGGLGSLSALLVIVYVFLVIFGY